MTKLVLFNKPYGVLSQFTSADGHSGLSDHLSIPGVYPAGRLDADSEGLLLLTDDGQLQHRLSHPLHGKEKSYLAQVEGAVHEAALAQLQAGVDLKSFHTRPCKARLAEEPGWLWPRTPPVRFRKHIPTSWLEITLTEGKNRQVRRMCAAVGFPCLRLVRIAIGPYHLDGLMPGQWREESLLQEPGSQTVPLSVPRLRFRGRVARRR